MAIHIGTSGYAYREASGPASRPAATFEFRHASWFCDEVYAALSQACAVLCIAESDKLATPRVATAKWGYLRLRKEQYKPAELVDWAAWIGAQKLRQSHVYFKHEDTARGTVLAKKLRQLVKGRLGGA